MEGPSGDEVSEFIASGRTGRRNALPHILDGKEVSTADLPDALLKLSCDDSGASTSGASGSSSGASTSGASSASSAGPSGASTSGASGSDTSTAGASGGDAGGAAKS